MFKSLDAKKQIQCIPNKQDYVGKCAQLHVHPCNDKCEKKLIRVNTFESKLHETV